MVGGKVGAKADREVWARAAPPYILPEFAHVPPALPRVHMEQRVEGVSPVAAAVEQRPNVTPCLPACLRVESAVKGAVAAAASQHASASHSSFC